MNIIAGYQILSAIYESANSLVYRAVKMRDRSPAIVKVLKQDYPTKAELRRYEQEYEILRNLNIQGVIKAYSLETYQRTVALILEDFGGISLRQFIQQRCLTLVEFLNLAVQLCEILGHLHAANVIHKDINPANIVVNPTTLEVKLIDFGIASVLKRANPAIKNPKILAGTLAYISPEQTGRMNRALDYRTDFYSLGVTFYELLAHTLPFNSSDPMELVHCHIAKKPPNPCQINPEIPPGLGEIILKLIAKNAEDRYQSAWGLQADLVLCLMQLEAGGIIEEIIPGQNDICDRFQIPQKLYGRETEIQTLLSSFNRITSHLASREVEPPESCSQVQPGNEFPGSCSQVEPGNENNEFTSPPPLGARCEIAENATNEKATEMLLISGVAGVGKTALVGEIYKPLTAKRGYFISGKFDQFQRNTPYSAVVYAFQELVRQLLAENQATLQQWREKLLAALGQQAQVIIDVIPEIELIIGSQNSTPEWEATEAQNRFNSHLAREEVEPPRSRSQVEPGNEFTSPLPLQPGNENTSALPLGARSEFNLVFQKLVRVFGSQEEPLILFLDNLQWADVASLNLIKLMMTGISSAQNLCLIGAYRSEEVEETHALTLTLDAIQKAGVRINQINLEALKLNPVTRLIADTLYQDESEVKPLALVTLAKTGGNPFFVNEFLKKCESQGLIYFDSDRLCWNWDIEQISSQTMTDNIVEFAIEQFQQLPAASQQILQLAACIGLRFNLATLATISDRSQSSLLTELQSALQAELILPDEEFNEAYKFSHSRVQQAAYALIEPEQKQAIHLKIGRLLLQQNQPDNLINEIFTIVDHLNIGMVEMLNLTQTDEQNKELEELIKLNLIAGKKAKAATAYRAALAYLTLGRAWLADDAWETQYELALELYVEAIEAAYLNGYFQPMNLLADVGLQQAKTLLDRVKIYQIKIQAYCAQKQLLEAIALGLQVVSELGLTLPDRPSEIDIEPALGSTAALISGRRIEDLINLPPMTDENAIASSQILSSITAAAYITAPQLFVLAILAQVRLSLQFGNTPTSAIAYAGYGIILNAVELDIKAAMRWANLGLNLIDKFNAVSLKNKILYAIYGLILPNKQHLKTILPLLTEAYQSGIETGDLEFAGYSLKQQTLYAYWSGQDLAEIEAAIASNCHILTNLKQELCVTDLQFFHQAILNLTGNGENPCCLLSGDLNIEELLKSSRAIDDKTALYYFYLNQLILCYLFGEIPSALENSDLAAPYLTSALGDFAAGMFYFYDALAKLAAYQNIAPVEQPIWWNKIAENQAKLQKMAQQAPMNYSHLVDLIAAEQHRVMGENMAAMQSYDRAITSAQKQEFIQIEALANELAGKFYSAWGNKKLAQFYFNEAYYSYTCWGAKAKVHDLEKRYSQLLKLSHRSADSTPSPITSTSNNDSSVLDLASAIKASQAISSELVLDNLLGKIIQIVIENAGAEKAYLLMQNQGQWVIEISGVLSENQIKIQRSIPICVEMEETETECDFLPNGAINYVINTKEDVVLSEPHLHGQFTSDRYIIANQPKSILCTPIQNQGKLQSILYLENNLTIDAFTPERLSVLKLLCSQAAISLENARLYQQQENYSQTLETKVTQRTQQLEAEITERQLLETKMQASESQVRTFFEAMTDLVFVIDGDRNIDLIPTSINYLYDPDIDIVSQTIDQFFKTDSEPNWWMPVLRVLETKQTLKFDYCISIKGQNFWFTARISPIEKNSVIWVARDISDMYQELRLRKQAEAALQQKNKELGNTLKQLKQAQKELIQSEKMAALGQLIAGVAHEVNTPLGAIRSSVENISNFWEQNLISFPEFLRSLSSERLQDFLNILQTSSAVPMLSTKEKRQYKRSLRKQLEAENISDSDTIADTLVDLGIYEANAQAIALLQDSSGQEFFNTAYQFTNLQKSTQTIKTATDRAAKVVFALKSYARFDSSEVKAIANPIEGIETILTLYHNQLKQGVQVTKNYAQDLPAILCYPDELNQVWTNLLHNALQAMSNQGQLKIEAKQQDNWLKISFTDSGTGIPPEVLPRIFEPFFTTKPPGEGSGLGLDIIKKIIEKHDGKIEVDSQPGETTFTVLIPIAYS